MGNRELLALTKTKKTANKMKTLLKLEHWHLFFIVLLLVIFSGNSFFGRIFQMAWYTVFFGWIYAIGMLSLDKLPEGHGINARYYKFSFVFLIISLAATTLLFGGRYSLNEPNYGAFGSSIWLVLPLHLYTMWSILHVVYFSAKMLTSKIEGKVVGFNKSSEYFFAILFFPIGVWFIQPKAQQLI